MGAGQSVTNNKGKSQLHIDEKKLQGDRGANSRPKEAIKKEKARFSRASKKIQSQQKELSEKNLALEESLTVEKQKVVSQKASLKSEKKRSQIVPCQSPRKCEA
ncbi:Spermatogenesis-associated protein 24 [Dissostichus eleginoides]|uniref:Spermatogenesis-associated protein 24 n=1 Tax=Dissostichus eleginoides TaxID=100907 RepID=A0AAD9FL65_DISEL|nr:Spermatogenesis-associated protein 24 [Dissostichus eleginoides]